jgi:hypothetical protein
MPLGGKEFRRFDPRCTHDAAIVGATLVSMYASTPDILCVFRFTDAVPASRSWRDADLGTHLGSGLFIR